MKKEPKYQFFDENNNIHYSNNKNPRYIFKMWGIKKFDLFYFSDNDFINCIGSFEKLPDGRIIENDTFEYKKINDAKNCMIGRYNGIIAREITNHTGCLSGRSIIWYLDENIDVALYVDNHIELTEKEKEKELY